ncbi:hypothetical protein [Cribrihabitans marinus]|uniref:hypothetical protein n=2 Tax=Cribrihabitans marinus TaxID=1227549 RepID=UPI000B851D4F|nr:hypothetical protein [Cribrihabitans marinus]GGH36319.1 hypothetical protein GCM10010973_30190 [Cribrihabitans marinus]
MQLWTVSEFLRERMNDTPEVDWTTEGAQTTLQVMFADDDEWSVEEAEERFQAAVRYIKAGRSNL